MEVWVQVHGKVGVVQAHLDVEGQDCGGQEGAEGLGSNRATVSC